MSQAITTPLVPKLGWHVLHLYYSVNHSQWSIYDDEEKDLARADLTALVEEIRATTDTQIHCYSVVSPKADLGFLLITPDLHQANAFEKRLSLVLGPDVLTPAYSYFSMTEKSEYTTTQEQYEQETLIGEKQLSPGSPEFIAALEEFQKRMDHYIKFRLYPQLPDWPMMCFYPMAKRRTGADNWYSLDFQKRRQLMSTHSITGRKYSGRILQMITASTGLDEHEWGVTLLSKDSSDIKEIVYEMRFDEVSARYAEFGDFYIGLLLPLPELFERVCLH